MRRRGIENVEPPERRRRPAEQEVKYIDEQQPCEENGERHASGRDDAAGVIDKRALLHCGDNAERHGDRHRHEQAEQGQFGRSGQPGRNIGDDRLAGGERGAEVAVRKVRDIAQELLGPRAVEPELGTDLLDRLRRRRRPREIGCCVARQHARQQERDDDHPDQARDHRQEPFAELPQHRLPQVETRCAAAVSAFD